MKNNRRQLERELRQAGASHDEAGALASIAGQLRLLKPADETPRAINWTRALRPVLLAIATLLIDALVVMMAQAATPTSWLYPAQKASDAVAIKIHPQYRATVMMRRAQQVHELVDQHAPPQVILATLDSYQTQAASYKTMDSTNYAAFEYCKTSLRQAAADAPGNVRQAILKSLNSLQNI